MIDSYVYLKINEYFILNPFIEIDKYIFKRLIRMQIKTTYMLLVLSTIISVLTAHGQVIDTNIADEITINSASSDKEVIVTETGSISNSDPSSIADNSGNVISIENGADASVDNEGEINATIDHTDSGFVIQNIANAISSADSNSIILNKGIINTHLSLDIFKDNDDNDELSDSVNGIYGNLGDNSGAITTHFDLNLSPSIFATEFSLNSQINRSVNGIYGNLGDNSGTITTDFDLNVSSDNMSNEIYISPNLEDVANGIYGNLNNNTGTITTELNYNTLSNIAFDDISYGDDVQSTHFINIYNSNNGVYGDLARNEGIINTQFSLNSESNVDINHSGDVYSDIYTGLSRNANGILGSLEANSGLITTAFTSDIDIIINSNSQVSGGIVFSPNEVANGVIAENGGNLNENNGIINTNIHVNVNTDAISTDVTADINESFTINSSGNGLYSRNFGLGENTGIISTHFNFDHASSSSSEIRSTGEVEESINGVYGSFESNKGIISTDYNLNASWSADNIDMSFNTNTTSNGVYGSLDENHGLIRTYFQRDLTLTGVIDHKEDVIEYSGNAIVFDSFFTPVTSVNTGSLLGHMAAVSVNGDESLVSFDNYGVMTGQMIYGNTEHDFATDVNNFVDIEGDLAAANNYGTYVKIDADGNVIEILQGSSSSIDGKTTLQAELQGVADSYNIYTSQTAISDSIINGVGAASGTVTLDGTEEFTITGSSLNAYHTALELKTENKVHVIDTVINGGGLQGEYPVIKGDDQESFIAISGSETVINGDVDLGGGDNIFVLDMDNVIFNGMADLGDGANDSFALYRFTGNETELFQLTEDYVRDGIFNEYLGDKITGFENIGLESGTLTVEDDFTDYGLYVGTEAFANFVTQEDYVIKNLRNDGIVNLSNGVAGNHLLINDNLTGAGIYQFDTDFDNKASDYITAIGNVSAEGVIKITSAPYNGSLTVAQQQAAANNEILLIEALNDTDKSDESFSLAPQNQYDNNRHARLTNSIFVWELKTSGNNLVLSYDDPVDPVDPVEPIEPPIITQPKPSIVAEIPAYTSLPTIGREVVMDDLDALHSRLGELRNNNGWIGSLRHNDIGFDDSKANMWVKGSINHFDFEADSSFDVSGTYGGVNFGVDKKFDLNPQWNIYTGIFGGYKIGDFETSGEGNVYTSNEAADIDLDSWSLGGYISFFNHVGSYVDLVVEYTDLGADIDAAGLSSSVAGYGLSGSFEVGHSIDLAKDWIIEPQAQLKLTHIHWDDLFDGTNYVAFEDHTYVEGRTGIRIEKTFKSGTGEIKPWIYMGASREFSGSPEITYADTIFESHDYDPIGEIKLGMTADIDDRFQFYAEGGYSSDFSDYDAFKGNIGLRLSW